MANPSRAMASMRRIDAITPIEGADRIETAHIGGWTCVVGKADGFREGDLCVFMEVDTFLPADDDRYASFAERGVKEMIVNGAVKKGHVLRTARLRGVYSQGLVLKPQDVLPSSIPESAYEQMYERKTNLTALCGVCEFDPIRTTEQGNMDILRKYDPWVAPRTDAERIQNVSEDVFNLAKRADYYASVKVDGTSITMLYDPRYNKVRLCSHNNELGYEKGFGKQVYEQAEEQGILKFLNDNPGVTCQMEAAGPKINGNRLNLKAMKLFVFSVWDTNERKYLNPYQLFDFANDVAVHKIDPNNMVPQLFINLNDYATTIDLIDYVDGLRGHVTDRLDEGLVIHLTGRGSLTDEEWRTLQGALDAHMQIKVISRKYLLKAKE